jgi:hypothetical protein
MNVPVRLANFRFEIFYGKRKSSRVPKGNVYLKTALVEALWKRNIVGQLRAQTADYDCLAEYRLRYSGEINRRGGSISASPGAGVLCVDAKFKLWIALNPACR